MWELLNVGALGVSGNKDIKTIKKSWVVQGERRRNKTGTLKIRVNT